MHRKAYSQNETWLVFNVPVASIILPIKTALHTGFISQMMEASTLPYLC